MCIMTDMGGPGLRDDGEALFLEMGIKSKDRSYFQATYYLEAHTVHKTEIAPCGGKNGADSRSMYLRGNKFNMEQGDNIFPESSDGIHSKPMLQESKAFHQNVAARDERVCTSKYACPRLSCFPVIVIIPVEQSIESGCIDEDPHLPYASER